ncbi:uncharacterized protein LOC114877375 [Osmia bicornis bicornis]|uniref:uncharacterized protein LOC114877375 n=1 Tax=Osmia bicornis bicornis TaxID=1437191 RepID=UPI001EAF24E2|nr:uncharacterized protein LOC114877375 [Osmia bicornis bicornis]
MKRGSKCIAQTINLSNPETCIRPKRIQKLVEAEAMQPCPSHVGSAGPSYWTPRPVAIKICTRKDMQRTCPPKLCDCPQMVPRKTTAQRLCRALIFLLKSSIAAGLIYWTNSEGLWGSSADVEDLYYRLMATISPSSSEDKEIQLPRFGAFKYRMIQTYNHAVFAIMSCILDTSTMLREQLRRILSPEEEPEPEPPASDESLDVKDKSPKKK